jgi:hypothetical protein
MLWGMSVCRWSSLVLLVSWLLAAPLCWPALGQTHAASKPAPSSPATLADKTKPPETKPAPLPPPIVFFVAKGDANACGPGCREWIAAEGTIDSDADGRLRALLKKLGGRKLPIFFHSPGGSVAAGLAIGRLMREGGMTAGVGWTVPAGCDPQQPREAACDKLKRSGRELLADLDAGHSMCNSSCVYALLGAAVRDVGAGIKLGIHSTSISFSLKRTDSAGHVTRMPTRVAPDVERKALQGGYERIAVYLHEMGISPGLLAAAREIKSDRLRYLAREELVAFGVDRREVVESTWWFVDQPSGASAIKIIEAKDVEAGAFRKTILRLSCLSPTTMRLQYGHEVGAEKASLPVQLRVAAGGNKFALGRGVTITQTDTRVPMVVHSADLPLSVLEDTAFVIEAAEPSDQQPKRAAVDAGFPKLTAQASGPALGIFLRRCSNGSPVFDRGTPDGRT